MKCEEDGVKKESGITLVWVWVCVFCILYFYVRKKKRDSGSHLYSRSVKFISLRLALICKLHNLSQSHYSDTLIPQNTRNLHKGQFTCFFWAVVYTSNFKSPRNRAWIAAHIASPVNGSFQPLPYFCFYLWTLSTKLLEISTKNYLFTRMDSIGWLSNGLSSDKTIDGSVRKRITQEIRISMDYYTSQIKTRTIARRFQSIKMV